VQDATIEVAVNYLPHIRPKKTVLLGKALVIDLFKFFKVILNALIILRILGFSRAIYGGDVGHRLISPATGQQPMQKFSEWERPWHGSTLAFWFGIWPIAAKIVLFFVCGWTVGAHC